MSRLEAAARSLALFAARRIARNRQVADVIFDRCRGTADLARSALNHLAFILKLPRTFYLTSVMLEVTNLCNLKCRFCPAENMKRIRGFMDPALAEHVLKDCKNLQYVYLYDWGEPMLHPELPRIIETATELGHRTFMVTNGTLLNPDLAEKIIKAGLSTICFSIDGIGQVYERLRGFDYGRLESNVLEFLRIKNELNPGLRVEINYVVSPDTESHVNEFRAAWGPRVQHITFQPMLTYHQMPRKRPCRELWKGTLVVLWDGTVVACCVDYDGALKVGDATRQNISEILNSKEMIDLRKTHLKGQFCSMCSLCSEFETECVDGRFDGRMSDCEAGCDPR
ncbi:MAG: radical SAM protein [Candidatus Coatesbacteria bacterium]|nr:radical SAM protein [Candidatus Coatesbacteria bacterium]